MIDWTVGHRRDRRAFVVRYDDVAVLSILRGPRVDRRAERLEARHGGWFFTFASPR